MGIVRTVLMSTIDLRNPKSLCKNLSLRKFKKLKFQYFPLYFCVYSLVKIKVQFWKGRWPRIKKFRKRKLLSTKFYNWKHLSQIWNMIFIIFSFFWPPLIHISDPNLQYQSKIRFPIPITILNPNPKCLIPKFKYRNLNPQYQTPIPISNRNLQILIPNHNL